MIYPTGFEAKIGFTDIRELLRARCMSTLGKERVDDMTFLTDASAINELLSQVRAFRRLTEESDDIPLEYFIDMRSKLSHLRLEGTHLEVEELFDLRRSLDTISKLKAFIGKHNEHNRQDTPTHLQLSTWIVPLQRLTEGIPTFPDTIKRIDTIVDGAGRMRDDASAELLAIRNELRRSEGSISRTLQNILRRAQSEGLVDKDAAPTMRDGRLVIPVAPSLRRRIHGIVHDESASGKTVFIEPAEVVEANNRIRELEAEERREILSILKSMASTLRPDIDGMVSSYRLLADIDFIRSKALLAADMGCTEPVVGDKPLIDWVTAEHPLLKLSLAKQAKKVVPLDITLDAYKMLIISGPNAGGKSVCLKTVGLVQYMLQCGVPVPMDERSRTGIFGSILIDIGDEQNIENDLSTYSSHLLNMKIMMRRADNKSLVLIDELGSGTEPRIGGAIAESVLEQLCNKQVYGVVTTHYQNLKHFADTHEGVANGAMLYDRNAMCPLFRLAIGQPGSSFAIDIARRIGLPDEVIRRASEIVGSEYIQSDRYLQDIVRDKRYWESKRKEIRHQEKHLQETTEHYEHERERLAAEQRDILRQAREEAAALLRESNRRIEQAIREIKEAGAEREDTKRIRAELALFAAEVQQEKKPAATETTTRNKRTAGADSRRARHDKTQQRPTSKETQPTAVPAIGSRVRMKGQTAVGTIETISGNQATVIFGDVRTRLALERLETVGADSNRARVGADPGRARTGADSGRAPQSDNGERSRNARRMREAIDNRRLAFKPDLDVRGLRGDEALTQVAYFLDDATMVGIDRVRILHGTGTGALRQLIRQYLATVPGVTSFKDEHVQFGGAGITVIEMKN